MTEWRTIYEAVAAKLQQLADNAPTPLWRNVFNEALNRWKNRREFSDGKTGSELTIKINVVDENAAEKALQRIAEFSRQLARLETDDVRVIMLGQKYRKDGNVSVLLRIRIVAKTAKTAKTRSKFVANTDEI